MVTEKYSCEQFRRDLKSLNYYKTKLIEVEDELLELATLMNGVSSPSAVKDVIIENKNPYQSKILEYILKEELLVKQRDNLKYMINKIEDHLQQLSDDVRGACIDLYIKGKNADTVAIERGFGHKMTMYRAINKEIDENY